MKRLTNPLLLLAKHASHATCCWKRENFSEVHILPPLEENNKGHKTNSHSQLSRFAHPILSLCDSFFKRDHIIRIWRLGVFIALQKARIIKANRKNFFLRCFCKWEKEWAVCEDILQRNWKKKQWIMQNVISIIFGSSNEFFILLKKYIS